MLPDRTESRKSKMEADKPKVIISQLTDGFVRDLEK